MLQTELWRENKHIASYQGLNDMVLAKAEIARMIDLEVNDLTTVLWPCVYKADGLIVASLRGRPPIRALHAAGPIVFPSVAAFSITPICPHMLTNRPVIVPDGSVIQVKVLAADHATYLTIDGQVGSNGFSKAVTTEDRIFGARKIRSS